MVLSKSFLVRFPRHSVCLLNRLNLTVTLGIFAGRTRHEYEIDSEVGRDEEARHIAHEQFCLDIADPRSEAEHRVEHQHEDNFVEALHGALSWRLVRLGELNNEDSDDALDPDEVDLGDESLMADDDGEGDNESADEEERRHE